MKKVFSLILTLTLAAVVILSSIILCRTAFGKIHSRLRGSEKSKSTEMGNSNGNLFNEGIAVQKGDWIYYVNGCSICKIKLDGSHRTILHKMDGGYYEFINVVGSWIYYQISSAEVMNDISHDLWTYRNIYKMKIDGTHETPVTNYTDKDECEDAYMNVVGDWIYYFNHTDGNKLYRIKTNGTKQTRLINHYVGAVDVAGDWVYYEDGHYCKDFIYKIRTDGSKKTKVSNKCGTSCLNVVGNWIYYIDKNGHICRMKTDGSKGTKVNNKCRTSCLNVVGNWIYYIDKNEHICRMKTDGSKITKISNDAAYEMNVAGNWVYYKNFSVSNKVYKIKTDGTGTMAVN